MSSNNHSGTCYVFQVVLYEKLFYPITWDNATWRAYRSHHTGVTVFVVIYHGLHRSKAVV